MTIENVADALPCLKNGSGYVLICPVCEGEGRFQWHGEGVFFSCEKGCSQEKIVNELGSKYEDFARLILGGLEIVNDPERRTGIDHADRRDGAERQETEHADYQFDNSNNGDNPGTGDSEQAVIVEKQTAPGEFQEPLPGAETSSKGHEDNRQDNGNHQVFQLDDYRPAPNKSSDARINSWKLNLVGYVQALSVNENLLNQRVGLDRATYREWVLDDLKALPYTKPDDKHLHPPAGLSETELEEELQGLVDAYLPARRQDAAYELTQTDKRRYSIIVEDSEQAAIADAEYLARPEVIERLGYSQSIALLIGAKHHGKTTMIRTLALSVARGVSVFGRKTTLGPVIYAASDEEVASTRNQLLNMGWRQGADPLHFAHIDPESDATPEQILEDIANEAVKRGAILIILDMLFDFVGIRNELSYAETRERIGLIQRLADLTKCLVAGAHHTPKYLTEAHEACNAALGSQGISARFSPIVMVRKYAENLYTVESTTTRDPRGQELKPTRITKDDRGWIVLGGEFKEWMKWEIYAQRILDLFDGKRGLTVTDVMEKLNLDRARVQNTLKQLTADNKLSREKDGRCFRYYSHFTDMFEREGGIWEQTGDHSK